jgi:hypothetical protein
MIVYILLLIILVLFAYILYMHVEFNKKNRYMGAVQKKMREIDENWTQEDLARFLSGLRMSNLSGVMNKNHIFDDNILAFIFEPGEYVKIFMHYTKDRETAESIRINGFRYDNSLYKTAESIHNDIIDLTYKHNLRRHYGKFVIIICISKTLYTHYSNELKNVTNSQVLVEHIFSSEIPVENEKDTMYNLPPQYIKGYVNYETGEIIRNPSYKPDYNSVSFNLKLNSLKLPPA